MMHTRSGLLGLIIALAFVSIACSGGDGKEEESFPAVQTIRDGEILPVINNQFVVVGPNRLVFYVTAPDGSLIRDAKVTAAFYELSGTEAIKRFETEMTSTVPARDAGVEEQILHIHPDGLRHIHVNLPDDIGFFTANVSFD